MGAEVNAHSPEPTPQEAQATLHLALQAARERQACANQGFFDHPHRTCDIEQEIQCLSPQTGMPVSAEALIASNALPGARFDTVTSIVEYDAGDIVFLERDALSELYSSLRQRTRRIQQALVASGEDAIVVPIGVQPLVESNTWPQWIVPQPGMRRRYHLIDLATRRENPYGAINIKSPDGRKSFTDAASYMAVMMRCAGTQFHISERNVEDALEAYNTSIHIAPIMSALFGNSPFIGGIDSGRTSTRTALFLQGEPLHMLAGTIRNEFRCIDAQSPFRSMQAFLLTLGATDGLRGRTLATYAESRYNLRSAVWGLSAPMCLQGRATTARAVARELVALALTTLQRNGLCGLGREFLTPLLENELEHGRTQADLLRARVNGEVERGRPWCEAVVEAMLACNAASL